MHITKKNSILLIAFVSLALQPLLFNEEAEAATLTQKRLWGQTRYETAAAISNAGWTTSTYAVLASGGDFPDALCSAPLAKKLNNAPILLTQKDVLNPSAEDQLKKLQVKTVYIVGGTGVISADVEKRLIQLGMSVTRIAGNDRYETSVKVAEQVGFSGQLVVASGENFADALSIAPIAAEKSMPIILTEQSTMPEVVKKYLENKNINKSYIIGGTGAVSDSVAKNINAATRIWGMSRYETNIAVLNEFYSSISHDKIYVAAGDNYADAVSGSALASANNSGMILVDDTLSDNTKKYLSLSANSQKQIQVFIYGGTGVVSNITLNMILDSLGLYTLTNVKNYEMGEKITITNNGTSGVRNVSTILHLGKINESPYQKNETISFDGAGSLLTRDGDGSYTAYISVPYVAPGQTLQYNTVRKFTNGQIVYNVDLKDTSGDYTGFDDYNKYTSPESKIESDNIGIKTKASEVTLNESNIYMKAKKIFDFVNMYMAYDYSQANKGAVNALTTAKGVCEDYSDLMVAMLRSVGIPSRVAYGYNITNKDFLSGDSDITEFRHAWVEFYIPEYGWVFAEPTIDYRVNGKKVAADQYFTSNTGGMYFVQTYTDDGVTSFNYAGYSIVNIDDLRYIKVLAN